jgi:hypothetical protein
MREGEVFDAASTYIILRNALVFCYHIYFGVEVIEA